MPSTLAWLDHDAEARDRTRRILALFQEKGTRDQLGLGGIRDSLSDLLFPGTSTIQTRLRYFLLVPWVYESLEGEGVPANRIGAEARQREIALIKPLISSDEEGVFGRSAGGELKRLPSDVYWGGLGDWGIRRFSGSRDEYHQAIDEIHRQRRAIRHLRSKDDGTEGAVVTWHPELPGPPQGFPDELDLSLRREEAEFLSDCIVAAQPKSLLAWLVLRADRTSVPYAWQHPRLGEMSQKHQEVLSDVRVFSDVMRGAAILYNWILCEEAGFDDRVDEHRESYQRWASELDHEALTRWSVARLITTAQSQGGYRIGPPTIEFVDRWVRLVREGVERIPIRDDARRLIRNREIRLKGARSLFRNRRALEERYGGALGLGRMSFRWPNVQVLLNDLHDGLERG